MSRTYADIIDAIGRQKVVETAGVSPITVNSWVSRNNIPAGYWRALVDAGLVDLNELVDCAKRPADPRQKARAA